MKEPNEEIVTQDEEQQNQQLETNAAGLPQTQEELDALIEKRIKREHKKWDKQQQQTEEPAEPKQATEAAAQNIAIQKELTEARAQLEAVKSGVRPDVVEDAVYLAMREIERSGEEADADSIREALQLVLKRYPSWKNDEKQKSGIKVGADTEAAEKASGKSQLPTGKVIF